MKIRDPKLAKQKKSIGTQSKQNLAFILNKRWSSINAKPSIEIPLDSLEKQLCVFDSVAETCS